MPRKPRFRVTGLPQHIIQRGHNRQPCFLDDTDRRMYLAGLEEALHRHDVELHAWVLMSNHVHLLATQRSDHSLSRMMQMLGRRYVRWFNDRHERSGTLWEGRYRASLVESEGYLLACMRYIELNPVRAGMVRHPRDYRWSSHAANALGAADPLVTYHPVYLALRDTIPERLSAYRRLCDRALGEQDLAAIREAANSGTALGTDAFKDWIEASIPCRARNGRGGRPRRESVKARKKPVSDPAKMRT
jgi:putative transposase